MISIPERPNDISMADIARETRHERAAIFFTVVIRGVVAHVRPSRI